MGRGVWRLACYATVVWTLGMAFFWLHFGALLGPQQRPYWIRKIRYGAYALLALAPVAQRWRDHTALVAGALVLIAPSMSGHATDLGGWGRWLVVAHALG